jgi:hypothetical protein
MSFILDALKKLERKRAGGIPTLDTRHEVPPPSDRLPWLIVGVLGLMVLGLVAWLLVPRQFNPATPEQLVATPRAGAAVKSPPAVPEQTAASPDAAPADTTPPRPIAIEEQPGEAVVPEPELAETSDAEALMDEPMLSDELEDDELDGGEEIDDSQPPITTPIPRPAAPDAKGKPAPAKNPPAPDPSAKMAPGLRGDKGRFPREEPPANKKDAAPAINPAAVPTVEQLPTDVQAALPTFSISILAYTQERDGRMVYINGRRYLEGEMVENKYKIELISRQGVVLGYDSQRFLVKP